MAFIVHHKYSIDQPEDVFDPHRGYKTKPITLEDIDTTRT